MDKNMPIYAVNLLLAIMRIQSFKDDNYLQFKKSSLPILDMGFMSLMMECVCVFSVSLCVSVLRRCVCWIMGKSVPRLVIYTYEWTAL